MHAFESALLRAGIWLSRYEAWHEAPIGKGIDLLGPECQHEAYALMRVPHLKPFPIRGRCAIRILDICLGAQALLHDRMRRSSLLLLRPSYLTIVSLTLN